MIKIDDSLDNPEEYRWNRGKRYQVTIGNMCLFPVSQPLYEIRPEIVRRQLNHARYDLNSRNKDNK
jgi:hypothetical protein